MTEDPQREMFELQEAIRLLRARKFPPFQQLHELT
jgi:hypothetical protein